MKKCHKSGFTLVEALLAIAIIGTVAALVLPPLISGAQNKKHAAALGRSVELIETGCQNLVQAMNENADNAFVGHYGISTAMNGTYLTGTSIVSGSSLFDYTADYFGVTPLSDSDKTKYTASVQAYNGETPNPSVETITDKFVANTKLGTYYGVKYTKGDGSETRETELIYIDVNGESSPNRYGRDIFLFNLRDDCHMIPAGVNNVEFPVPLATAACSGTNITNGLSCTSRVVRDGYKIEYMKQ